jgi:cystathionine beta-lyase/cystathionine gamma-synthase
MSFETDAIHAGDRPDKAYGAISVPIYQSSTFAFEDVGKTTGYDYSRSANPTRHVLEQTMARLEGGKAGFACASGMAAVSLIIHQLKAGDHVIVVEDIYGGTHRMFHDVMTRFGLEFSFIKMTSPEAIEKHIKPNSRMMWLETPSNPLLHIVDLEMCGKVAKKHKLISVMDNTFSSPYFLHPMEYGIDIVMHSTTKYLGGHSDVVGGIVVVSTDELSQKFALLHNELGGIAGPFDSWLVLRGIETLPVRMRQHESNAMAIAKTLQCEPVVEKVYYPGLPEHPGHALAHRQMKGFGGMVSFEIKGGLEAANRFLGAVKVFTLAESLGGITSLAGHPMTQSHASMTAEQRAKVGIKDNLIRLSVGLENIDDLLGDLKQALAASQR